MKLRQIVREYFTFTRNERIGLIILLILILIALAANQLVFYFEKPGQADQKKYKQLLAMLEEKQQESTRSWIREKLFYFDPNMIDTLGLDSLQLPYYVKKNLLAYRAKGGRLYDSEDFRKIYGMNDSVFAVIKPYLQMEERRPVTKASFGESDQFVASTSESEIEVPVQVQMPLIEINAATADDLKALYGIGDVLSTRIVKYRDLLGGFSRLEQLYEVYGLKPETIENIVPYLKLDTSRVEQINVNFAKAQELARHPYVSWDLANAIIEFRSVNGFVNDLKTIQLNELMSEEEFQKISPYWKTKN